MFVDKLSARILIFRHYLEIEYDDNETFKWTETLFNDLLQRKMLLNYFNNINDISASSRLLLNYLFKHRMISTKIKEMRR